MCAYETQRWRAHTYVRIYLYAVITLCVFARLDLDIFLYVPLLYYACVCVLGVRMRFVCDICVILFAMHFQSCKKELSLPYAGNEPAANS